MVAATIFFLQFNSIEQFLCCRDSKEKTKQERCFTLLNILVLEISVAQNAILGTTYFPPPHPPPPLPVQNSLKLSIFGFLKIFPGWVLTAHRDPLLKLLPILFLDPFPTGWEEKKGGSQRNSRTQVCLFYLKGVWTNSKQCIKVVSICTGNQCRFWKTATTSLLFDLTLNTLQETWILTTGWQRHPARKTVLNDQKGKKSCLGMQC